MKKGTGKGIFLTVLGVTMEVGYIFYLLREINSRPEEIQVSLSLLALPLLMIPIGAMHIFLGEDKTAELMSLNTANLSKRDILIASVPAVIALGVAVATTLFLASRGYL